MRPFVPVLATAAVLLAVACSSSDDATPAPPVALDPPVETRPDAAVADTRARCAPAPPKGEGTFADPSCPVRKPAQPDALDEALAKAGLDRCTLGYTPADWSMFATSLTKDPYRLPWYDGIHDHAVRAPAFGRGLVESLDTASASELPVTGALQVAAFALGSGDTPCIEPFVLDETQPLARAVAQVIRDAGGEPDDASLEEDAADVPLPLQRAMAEVVLAANEAEQSFKALASSLSAADLAELAKVPALSLSMEAGPPTVTAPTTASLLSKRFDEVALARGAVVLALRVEREKLATFAGLRGFEFEQDTPLGRVVLRDAESHTHGAGSHVLVSIDTGGDDSYLYPAGAVDGAVKSKGAVHHVGLAIDLAGHDTYGYAPVPDSRDGARLPSDGNGRYASRQSVDKDNGPVSLSETLRQGAARLGYGMLFDLGAEPDTYRSLRFSQGYGAAGVGVLFDAGGDDVYEGEAGVQGAAHFGVGLLVDQRGDDVYRSYTQTQGYAYVRGVGVLYDATGSDKYLVDNGDPADGGDPLYWTPQVPGKGNNSFAQGAAWGRRSPGSGDDADMSGGLGILRDREGHDVYVASVDAQGAGYWFGTGMLADGAGNDTYDARYYVQGSGAHFALALFLEDGGDDLYNSKLVPKATSIGVGHDFTVSWHIDLGGNDVYRAPVLSLGAGNANGVGILINVGGDDIYRSEAEPTIGAANLSAEVNTSAARRAVPTTGIFVDVGGHDLYEVTGATTIVRGDDLAWRNDREPPASGLTTEHGAGVDRGTGSVSLP